MRVVLLAPVIKVALLFLGYRLGGA